MKREEFTRKALVYVKKNWFKIILLLLLVFVFFKKDLTFSINLNSPNPTEEEMEPKQKPVQRKLPPKKQHLMTEDVRSTESETTQTNRFDLHSIGSNQTPVAVTSELASIEEAEIQAFLKRFAQVAIDERKKYGIPSSIILANALLHSHAGKRDLTLQGHNYFALPCTSDWKGQTGEYQGSCYRHYPTAWMSFRDHSLFLTTGKNADLPKLGATDYQAWAKALEQRNFSEQKDLAAQLVLLIEKYELAALDTAVE